MIVLGSALGPVLSRTMLFSPVTVTASSPSLSFAMIVFSVTVLSLPLISTPVAVPVVVTVILLFVIVLVLLFSFIAVSVDSPFIVMVLSLISAESLFTFIPTMEELSAVAYFSTIVIVLFINLSFASLSSLFKRITLNPLGIAGIVTYISEFCKVTPVGLSP